MVAVGEVLADGDAAGRVLLMAADALAPVDGACHGVGCGAVGDGIFHAHLHDVNLAAFRPVDRVVVLAHHPEGWPQAVGKLGELDTGLNLAMGERHLMETVDAPRGKRLAIVALAAGSDDEVAVGNGHILRTGGVSLHLFIIRCVGSLDVPVGAEGVGVELIAPHQVIVLGIALCADGCHCVQHESKAENFFRIHTFLSFLTGAKLGKKGIERVWLLTVKGLNADKTENAGARKKLRSTEDGSTEDRSTED